MNKKHKIGIIGLGKLGQSLYDVVKDNTEHEVVYYDIITKEEKYVFNTIDTIKQTCTLIFICVNTPEDPDYDGSKMYYTYDIKEFDYDYDAVYDSLIELTGTRAAVVISSTMSPNGIEKLITETGNLKIIYNPFMFEGGNEYKSILNQTNIIIGSNRDPQILIDFYKGFTPKSHIHKLSFVEASLLKMLYNSYVSMRINFTNSVLRLTYETGGDAQTILNALKDFPIFNSPKFLNIGLPSGGPCIPRDTLTISKIAKDVLFDCAVNQRMEHVNWLSDNISDLMKIYDKNVVSLYGLNYKEGVNNLKGSAAVLLKNSLESKNIKCYIDREVYGSFNVLLNEDREVMKNKSLYYDIWLDRIIVKE